MSYLGRQAIHLQAWRLSCGNPSREFFAAASKRPISILNVGWQVSSLSWLGHETRINPLSPSSGEITPLLHSLFRTHGLAAKIFKGYRSYLASVFIHTGKIVYDNNRLPILETHYNPSSIGTWCGITGLKTGSV